MPRLDVNCRSPGNGSVQKSINPLRASTHLRTGQAEEVGCVRGSRDWMKLSQWSAMRLCNGRDARRGTPAGAYSAKETTRLELVALLPVLRSLWVETVRESGASRHLRSAPVG